MGSELGTCFIERPGIAFSGVTAPLHRQPDRRIVGRERRQGFISAQNLVR